MHATLSAEQNTRESAHAAKKKRFAKTIDRDAMSTAVGEAIGKL
jgi:hypothetical protein